MDAKELYRQKLHAQLLEWQADAQKLRALSEKASADAQTVMRVHIAELDAKIDAASTKLLELADMSEGAWETTRASFESAWETLSAAVRDATAKLRN